ncbi:MAG: dTDP-4-dehydrorhamnose 3,5-epimerase family protein [Caldilineaceae bacterium]
MTEIIQSDKIQGVKYVNLRAFSDVRGRFLETFRKEWFPERSWEAMQMNRSDSQKNVLRGLHYHFKQADYWYTLNGSLRVGLADLRPTSPTYGRSEVCDIGGSNETGVFIPPGVAHGFVALTDVTLVYVVDQYYNAADEFGVIWNDQSLGIQWNVNAPILSERDQNNPPLADIPAINLP